MDKIAKELAENIFDSNVNIVQTRNYYLEYITSEFNLLENKTFNSIVFLSDPTNVGKTNLSDYEYELLEDLLSFFNKSNIIIRLHPSEHKKKYATIISKYPSICISTVRASDEDLLTTLSKSTLTIGLGSMALYISYILGIRTISYVSNSGREKLVPASIPPRYVLKNLKEIQHVEFEVLKDGIYNENIIEFYAMINSILKES